MAHKQNGLRRGSVVTFQHPETLEQVRIYPYEDLPEWAPLIDNESVFLPEEVRDESGGYDDLKVPELMQIARGRNIELTSTRKKDIIAALTLDDQDDGVEDLDDDDNG